MATTMISPARSSARCHPKVYFLVLLRRPSEKAIHSGMAVRASVRLCSVSESNATEPVNTTTTAWSAAVNPNPASETLEARTPAAPVSSPAACSPWSCECDTARRRRFTRVPVSSSG